MRFAPRFFFPFFTLLAACGGRVADFPEDAAPGPYDDASAPFDPDAGGGAPADASIPPPDAASTTLPKGFLETPVKFDEDVGLFAVWAGSRTDAWAAGWPSLYGYPTPYVHWDGTSWTQVHALGHDGTVIHGIWGSGASDVWFAGETNDDGYVLHWDGVALREVFHATHKLWAVTGRGPRDVWVGGYGALHHWDGTSWTETPMPAEVWGLSGDWAAAEDGVYHWNDGWTNVHPTRARAVFAIGGQVWLGLGTAAGGLERFDGATWAPVSTGLSYVASLWGSSGADLWALDVYDGDRPQYSHLGGTTWSSPAPPSFPTFVPKAVSGTASDDVWFVGADHIFHWGG